MAPRRDQGSRRGAACGDSRPPCRRPHGARRKEGRHCCLEKSLGAGCNHQARSAAARRHSQEAESRGREMITASKPTLFNGGAFSCAEILYVPHVCLAEEKE